MSHIYNLRSSTRSSKFNIVFDKKKNSNVAKSTAKTNMATKLTATLDSILQYLPNFEGKANDNITFFLKQFDDLVEQSDLENSVKLILLKSKISGKAKELFFNLPDLLDCNDYAQLKTLLEETFAQTTIVAKTQADFMTLKQQPAQNIEEYIKIFNIKSAKYLKDSGHASQNGAKQFLETIKLHKFIDSVRNDIAFELRKAGVKTFEEAINLAKTVELALNANENTINCIANASDDRQNNTDPSQILSNTVLSMSEVYGKQLESMQQQIDSLKIGETNNSNKTTRIKKSCMICKFTGHTLEECYYNARVYPEGNPNARRGQRRGEQNFQVFEHDRSNYYNPIWRAGGHRDPNMQNFIVPQQQNPPFIMPQLPYNNDASNNVRRQDSLEDRPQNWNQFQEQPQQREQDYGGQQYQNQNIRGSHENFPRRGNYRGRYLNRNNNRSETRPTVTFPENSIRGSRQ